MNNHCIPFFLSASESIQLNAATTPVQNEATSLYFEIKMFLFPVDKCRSNHLESGSILLSKTNALMQSCTPWNFLKSISATHMALRRPSSPNIAVWPSQDDKFEFRLSTQSILP